MQHLSLPCSLSFFTCLDLFTPLPPDTIMRKGWTCQNIVGQGQSRLNSHLSWAHRRPSTYDQPCLHVWPPLVSTKDGQILKPAPWTERLERAVKSFLCVFNCFLYYNHSVYVSFTDLQLNHACSNWPQGFSQKHNFWCFWLSKSYLQELEKRWCCHHGIVNKETTGILHKS